MEATPLRGLFRCKAFVRRLERDNMFLPKRGARVLQRLEMARVRKRAPLSVRLRQLGANLIDSGHGLLQPVATQGCVVRCTRRVDQPRQEQKAARD